MEFRSERASDKRNLSKTLFHVFIFCVIFGEIKLHFKVVYMWRMVEIASGRKSCDNSDLESSDIFPTLSILEKNFVINYDENPGIGLNIVGFDLRINGERVTMGWDNWSGIFIMSSEPSGDVVIEKIYKFLEGI